MKYIKLFEEFLFEIGDGGAKSYNYKVKSGKLKDLNDIGNTVKISFKSDSGLIYLLELRNILNYLAVDFSVGGEWPETNKGEMYRIMSTVSGIVKTVLNDNPNIRGIRYEPKSKGHDSGISRDRLYRAFIQSAANQSNKRVEFMKAGGTIIATFKK